MSSPENQDFDPQMLDSEPQPQATPVVETFALPQAQPVPPTPKYNENPVWSGWDVLQIAGLTLFTLFIAQLLIVLGARHFAFPHASFMEVAQKPSLALLSELLTYVAVALYMILLVEGKYHARFWQAIRWNWPGIAGVSFLGIGVLMLGGLGLLEKVLPMPKSTPFDQFLAHRSDAYLTAVFAVTLGPLMEEVFFRGFLYPVVARRTGAVPAILITGVLFGAIHSPQYGYSWAVLIIVLVGLVLTTIRAVTKSVASSFLAHVGYNGIQMILLIWATDGFRHMEKAAVLLSCIKP